MASPWKPYGWFQVCSKDNKKYLNVLAQWWRYVCIHESESCSVLSDSLRPHGLYSPWNSPGQDTGLGSLSLLQRIFPTQVSNSGLPHCRWILYQLSHKGSIFMKWHNCIFMFHFGSQMGNTQKRGETKRQKGQLKAFASCKMI